MSLVALRRALLGAACLLASAPASGALAAGGHPEPLPTIIGPGLTCAKTMVYASRGSSENNPAPAQLADAYYDGLGTEMVKIWDGLKSYYGAADIRLSTNRREPHTSPLDGSSTVSYPALSGLPTGDDWVDFVAMASQQSSAETMRSVMRTYSQSVAAGVDSAVADLMYLRSKCKSSNIVIIGYSEGAEVTRRALDRLNGVWWHSGYTGKVFTMLFGDVLWSYNNEGGQTYVGDTSTGGRGVIRRVGEGYFGSAGREFVPPIPTIDARWNVTSWCHGGDIACQAPAGTTIAHQSYGEEDGVGAPGRAAQSIGAPTIKAIVTAKLNYNASCISYAPQPLKALLTVTGSSTATAPAADTFYGAWESSPTGRPFSPWSGTVQPGAAPAVKEVSIADVSYPWNWRLVVSNSTGQKLDYRNKCG